MRELRFLLALLQQITDGVHAREAAAEAYRVELAPFHGPMLQRTFRWGLWAGAGTEEVLAGLGGARQSHEATAEQARTLLAAAAPVVQARRAPRPAEGASCDRRGAAGPPGARRCLPPTLLTR